MKKNGRAFILPACGCALMTVLCIVLRTLPDRLAGAAFCHQLPSRSPAFGFPFCYRCSGLFAGIFWSLLFSCFSRKREKLLSPAPIIAFFAAICLFLTDIINTTEFIPVRWYEESTGFRFISSFPLGFMLVQVISAAFFYCFKNISPLKRLSENLFLPVMVISAELSYLIIFSESRILLGLFRFPLALGAFAFLTGLFSILIKCVTALRNREISDRKTVTTAFMLALFYICLIGGLHIRFISFEILA